MLGFSRQKAACARGLAAPPGRDGLHAWAERWRPLRAVAARFLWYDDLSRRSRRSAA